MQKAILAGLIGICLVDAAVAQNTLNRSRRETVKGLIEEAGGVCEEVIRNQDVGRIDNNTTLMAVACTGTDYIGYVIVVDSRGNMSFYATCEALAEANNNQVRCFT